MNIKIINPDLLGRQLVFNFCFKESVLRIKALREERRKNEVREIDGKI